MRSDKDPGDLSFAGLEPPAPPAALRERAIGSAKAALRRQPTFDPWSRLWNSRPMRFAWGVTVLALLVGHLALSWRSDAGPAAAVPPRIAGTIDAELQTIASLPRIDRAVLGEFAWLDQEQSEQLQQGDRS